MQIFENNLFKVSAKTEGEQILFDVEQVAKSLGFTQTKNKKEYIRWETVNRYLEKYVSQQVGKGDLIPEPLVYKLAFKAQNELAEKFQDWLAIEVIPAIRKTGSYDIKTSQLSPELQMFNGLFQSLAKQELATKQLETKVDGIRDVVALNTTDWREDSRKLINKIAQSRGGFGAYKEVNSEVYYREHPDSATRSPAPPPDALPEVHDRLLLRAEALRESARSPGRSTAPRDPDR